MNRLPDRFARRSFSFADAVQGFLLDDGLPFSRVLDAERIEAVFRKHQSLFGGIYSTAIVLWAFIGQVLRDGKEAACQSAVANIVAYLQMAGRPTPTEDTGDYCLARAKLSEHALRELSYDLACQAEEAAEPSWLWKGRHTWLIDGFTFMMADTLGNQQVYPQHTAQKPGLGFPIARVACILSLATGSLIDAAIGPYAGKESGETALLRRLIRSFKPGDLIVADRYFCNYWMIAMLMQQGVQICFRKHQKRHTDFRKARRLGNSDYLTTWERPKRPAWMTCELYQTMPPTIELREVRYTVHEPGRKREPFIIVTTLVDGEGDKGVSRDDLAELYSFRWNAELDIRCIKSYLNLHQLRCKSPEMVRREFWTTILAYNLIRLTIAGAAALHERQPRDISFTSACQYVLASRHVILCITAAAALEYGRTLLQHIARCPARHRPGRIEPRVIKKRRDHYTLMTQPRHELRKRLQNRDNAFEY